MFVRSIRRSRRHSSRTDPTYATSHIPLHREGALDAGSSWRVTAGALLGSRQPECLAAQGYKLGVISIMAVPCDSVPPLVRRVGVASPNARDGAKRVHGGSIGPAPPYPRSILRSSGSGPSDDAERGQFMLRSMVGARGFEPPTS